MLFSFCLYEKLIVIRQRGARNRMMRRYVSSDDVGGRGGGGGDVGGRGGGGGEVGVGG